MGLVSRMKQLFFLTPQKDVSVKPKIQLEIERGTLVVSNKARLEGLTLEVRATDPTKKCYMSIGCDSIVSGMFVIENPKGNISIGDRTFIGGGRFISINQIHIGSDVMFSWGCTVMDNDAHSLDWRNRVNDVSDWKRGLDEKKIGAYKDWSKVESAPIRVEDKCWIGFDVIILKGVTIGEGAVVAAGSVVTKDVAPYTLAAGNPARFIKDLPR